MFRRREFLAIAGASALQAQGGSRIDRRELVKRHNPVLTAIDANSPLSVGNGEFAFTVDVTGLQSLSDVYAKAMPLCTQSQWGWHTTPPPKGLDVSSFRLEQIDTYGRPVGYASSGRGQEAQYNWLRENPHRLNLARIGFLYDGKAIEPGDLSGIRQSLDLWTATIESRFALRGTPVRVTTRCHPTRDCVAVEVESALVQQGLLTVALDFPYGSPDMTASDWKSEEKHQTAMSEMRGATGVRIARTLDADRYAVLVSWREHARADQTGKHRVVLSGRELAFTCEFSPEPVASGMWPAQVFTEGARYWEQFWLGGAVDFGGSTDRRAEELERRVVLSQYLTAIQCSGSAPPQETGLVCNSWYGKFHLEMHWWHAAHFPLWGRARLLERSMGWYGAILASARDKAKLQGYRGARWPKMTALDGRSSPSNVGELLIWQQPHPIMLAELCYRAHPNRQTADRYAEIVEASADFMADFAVLRDGRYVLGPPVIPAQENHEARKTWNPTFELAYWHEALGVAQEWRKRHGLAPQAKWEDVRQRLSKLPVKDGVYLAQENCPETFSEKNRDHPSMLAALGVLHGEGVDQETMRRTLDRVLKGWKWEDTWGWDFPMTAMTAARLGEPEKAVDAFFIESPKNTWRANGHNWQRANLPCYLPGNGGLLIAVAMMAAAWDGFPRKNWSVRWDGLMPLLGK